VTIVLGEASGNTGCRRGTQIGCWDFTNLRIIMDDDTDTDFGTVLGWYYGLSPDPTVEPDRFDFLSTIVHEVGHVVGLTHFGTCASGAIMTADVLTRRSGTCGILRDIDASATHGVRDLYAIVPEPGTLALLILGLLPMAAGVRSLRTTRRSSRP
jgi:hypothetical protein